MWFNPYLEVKHAELSSSLASEQVNTIKMITSVVQPTYKKCPGDQMTLISAGGERGGVFEVQVPFHIFKWNKILNTSWGLNRL